MGKLKNLRLGLAIVLVLSLFLTACGQQNDNQRGANLTMASWGTGSGWYSYAATMADLLRDGVEGISTVDVLPYAGAIGNPTIISNGEADFGLAMNITGRWASEGTVAYDEPVDNISGLVGGLDQYYMAVVASEKLQVKSLEEIVEKQIPVNLVTVSRGGAGELATRLILESYGTSYEEIRSWGGSVNHNDFDVIVSDMNDGRADLFIHMITPGHPSLTQITVSSNVVFLDLNTSSQDNLVENYGFEYAQMPNGTFRGQQGDTETVGLRTTLIANSDMDEDVAYGITKAIVEGQQKLGETHAGLKSFNPAESWKIDQVGIELHPGAQRYFKEKGFIE